MAVLSVLIRLASAAPAVVVEAADSVAAVEVCGSLAPGFDEN